MIKSLNQQRRVMSDRLQDPTFTKKDGSVLNLTYMEWNLFTIFALSAGFLLSKINIGKNR